MSDSQVKYKYSYTPIDQINPCGQYCVYGVVKYCYDVKKSKTNDYYMNMGIYNEILHQQDTKLKMCVFGNRPEDLPVCKPGDIIRLHRLQVDKFRGELNAKLQLKSGGSWVVFSPQDQGHKWTASSSTNPTYDPSLEDVIIDDLRAWIEREDPKDQDVIKQDGAFCGASVSLPNTSTSVAHGSPNRSITNLAHCSIQSINDGTYFHLTCQLMKRAILSTAELPHKLAILTVWDGTKCHIDLNKPNYDGLSIEEFNSAIISQLPDYCVNLILYGAHVKRARQLKLGGIYSFYSVHCKLYAQIGRPELYLHDRHTVLAVPAGEELRNKVIEQLENAVEGLDNVHLDITADDRTAEEMDKELESCTDPQPQPSGDNSSCSLILSNLPTLDIPSTSTHPKSTLVSPLKAQKRVHADGKEPVLPTRTPPRASRPPPAATANLCLSNEIQIKPVIGYRKAKLNQKICTPELMTSLAQAQHTRKKLSWEDVHFSHTQCVNNSNHSFRKTREFVRSLNSQPVLELSNSDSDRRADDKSFSAYLTPVSRDTITLTPSGHCVIHDKDTLAQRFPNHERIPYVRLRGDSNDPASQSPKRKKL